MITTRSEEELKSIRASCLIVSAVLKELIQSVASGITTKALECKAEEMILRNGGEPAFKGYRGFPGSMCCSVNEEVVHGIPGPRVLKDGDIVSLDLGVKLNGYYGDAAVTVPVGRVNADVEKLLRITKQALYEGIEKARPGNRLSDISHVIQSLVERSGYSVVRDFVGHGIGKNLHEEPEVPNFGEPGKGPRLRPGLVLAIEPMVNMGKYEVRVKDDNWTVVTADGKPSAHFEHTVIITENEPEILTDWGKF